MYTPFPDIGSPDPRFPRRAWLRVAGLTLGGVSLPVFTPPRASAAEKVSAASSGSGFGKAKCCILLFLAGGPPQHETWDPKPEAGSDIRGEFGAIATRVPGLRVGELMPRLAAQADRWAVLRAMRTADNAHSASGYYMLTGQPHQPKNQENATPRFPNLWPCHGAVVYRLRPAGGLLPNAVTLPEHLWNTGMITWPGQDAGYLGRTWDPWLVNGDPNDAAFEVTGLAPIAGVDRARLDERFALLQQLNSRSAARTRGQDDRGHDAWNAKAAELLGNGVSSRAFDLAGESAATRDRYGRHRFGQSVLLARRLVESGVTFVQVNWTRSKNNNDSSPMWDTHANHNQYLKTDLMPPMDQACAALIDDLADRGLLDETLVVWMGEFGRSPKFNGQGGRDHWGDVFSIALAGGGVRGGIVHGASDKQGAQPLEGIVRPEDLQATIFHLLGLSSEATITDQQGRPQPITRGEIVRAIL